MYTWQKFHPIQPEFWAPFYWEAFDVNWCPLEMRHGEENESVSLHSNFRLLIPWITQKCTYDYLKSTNSFWILVHITHHCSKEQPVCSWCGHLLFFQPMNNEKTDVCAVHHFLHLFLISPEQSSMANAM